MTTLALPFCLASPTTAATDDPLKPRSHPPHQVAWQLSADQPPLLDPLQDPAPAPAPASVNLIDLLTSSNDHSILLRLLQRTRLIPTLNRLQQLDDGAGITILAPTDEAFLRKRDQQHTDRLNSANQRTHAKGIWEWLLLHHYDDQDDDILALDDSADVQWIWKNDDVSVRDNVNAVARQHLLYHVLNYTLPYHLLDNRTGPHHPDSPLPAAGKPEIHETMHFPSRRLLREPTHPGRIPLPDQEDHGGLIGDEGQKIRVATIEIDPQEQGGLCGQSRATSTKKPKPGKPTRALVFGTDHQGRGGARSIFENWDSPYGVIHSIDGVLDLPPSLQDVLETHPALEKLRTLLTPDLVKTLSTTAHLSLFLPTSEAFGRLSDIEWRFLSGKWQQSFQDRLKIMGWHMSGVGVGGGRPAYAHRLREQGDSKITTVLGGQVSVEVKDGAHIYVDGGKLVEEDIFTENGVVHLIDDMILPFGDLGMTVEEYLLALNSTKFVQLFHDAGLEDYIQRPPRSKRGKETFTFLAPRDDVIDDWMRNHRVRWPAADASLDDDKTPSLQEVVKYHILPGLVRPQDLVDGSLLGTELRDWKLREGRQRIPVQVDDGAAPSRQGNGDVGFGDANVLREPVEVPGSAVIYIISQLLEPPSNPIQTAVSHLTLSTFVATVFSAELKKAVQRAPGITYLIPTNEAFSGLALAMNYLLLPESQPQLQRLIEFHAIDKIVYMDDFQRNATEYPTLLPAPEAKVVAERLKNGTVLVSRAGDDDAAMPPARVIKGDILTNTGVIHEIDRVQMPLDLTIKNLMQGAKADTMEDLIQQAGYGWILNGSSPVNGSRGADRSYVVLVPTDNAFTRVNLSRILEDPVSLRRLVQQHIIPLDAGSGGVTVDDILPDGRRNRLTISESQAFPTMLDVSAGGESRYGQLSFRRIDDDVGGSFGADAGAVVRLGRTSWAIKGTRGSDGSARGHSAYVVKFGRESRAVPGVSDGGGGIGGGGGGGEGLRRGIGGVMLIDTVIMPYRPGWFYRWGWVVVCSVVAAFAMSLATLYAYRWWKRDGKIRLPDALEGEEE
ncbi:uncharacterized protein PFL1_00670 [Pseudozyma flocculosa PF-1]|uniref:uncharacterized protein n=1 Tax=Pseudozyma flocculosa PF-1 TaxID=1277687 RepID=UPI0004560341|nr:uncharacterized protein PFL1_00670 [Pseudozyma flocculosa PF-1]EPQ32475.1 hypothetical protein PFL1_00670 [Pseudozyma flocculosa PF-1]